MTILRPRRVVVIGSAMLFISFSCLFLSGCESFRASTPILLSSTHLRSSSSWSLQLQKRDHNRRGSDVAMICGGNSGRRPSVSWSGSESGHDVSSSLIKRSRTRYTPPQLYASNEKSKFDDVNEEGGEENMKKQNPYADPNYPDLEFVNYDDPEYQVDQGGMDEFYYDASSSSSSSSSSASRQEVEEEIERMREERRKRNDEFQFQTYFSKIHQNGHVFRGEWTVYSCSNFLPNVPNKKQQQNDDDDSSISLPRLFKTYPRPLQVQSRAYKTFLGSEEEEGIVHEEQVVSQQQQQVQQQPQVQDEEILLDAYWPEPLQMQDFRGPQGIMVVGNAYTTSTAVPLHPDDDDDLVVAAAAGAAAAAGPYREYRAEVGIQAQALRFRVKLNYEIPPPNQQQQQEEEEEDEESSTVPPLLLKTLVVCREQQTRDNQWVSVASSTSSSSATTVTEQQQQQQHQPHVSFRQEAGAPGGLYDPPPVGDADQASQYMLLDLEGRASLLFPYRMDQTPEAFNGNGWVTSLDWTPSDMRFQVDRKVHSGPEILGIRTLELSEVLGKDADTYRPRDGGQNMRQ